MALDFDLANEIIKRADIVQVIGAFIPVIKKGKNYMAKCPFHDDSNPSLCISPEKKIFKCFVCGTSGSCITFVQKYTHCTFFEALKKVADIIGFHDERLNDNKQFKKKEDPVKESILKCLKDLTTFYQYSLNTEEGSAGLQYFERRHIDSSMRNKYQLGYAINDGKKTIDFLKSKGHSIKTIEDTGISFISNGEYFDKNKGRAIFPITDSDGNVVGFSARRLKDSDEAKYINSPETYVFHKSKILYNFHIAKEKAKTAGKIYVLEGFMDVFALGKIGVDNAVALMGTALSKEHIDMLRMLNVEIILCLDGDLPGQTAALKNSKLLENAGLKVSIVDNCGSEKDPDEILNTDGENSLRVYIDKTLNRVDFALKYFMQTNPLKTAEQKKKLLGEFVLIMANINDQLDYDNYLRKLSNITGYDIESIRKFMSDAKRKISTESTNESTINFDFHPEKKLLRKLGFAERELLYQMLHNKEAVDFYEKNVDGFYDDIYRQIANYLIEYGQHENNFSVADLITMIETSDCKNKEKIINEISNLELEENHIKQCDEKLLNNLLDSINTEKNKVFENDLLENSLKGKDPLEQARIVAEFNRKKNRFNN